MWSPSPEQLGRALRESGELYLETDKLQDVDVDELAGCACGERSSDERYKRTHQTGASLHHTDGRASRHALWCPAAAAPAPCADRGRRTPRGAAQLSPPPSSCMRTRMRAPSGPPAPPPALPGCATCPHARPLAPQAPTPAACARTSTCARRTRNTRTQKHTRTNTRARAQRHRRRRGRVPQRRQARPRHQIRPPPRRRPARREGDVARRLRCARAIARRARVRGDGRVQAAAGRRRGAPQRGAPRRGALDGVRRRRRRQ